MLVLCASALCLYLWRAIKQTVGLHPVSAGVHFLARFVYRAPSPPSLSFLILRITFSSYSATHIRFKFTAHIHSLPHTHFQMHASTILSLLLATGFATAAPRAVPCDLTENDIIVYGAGGHFEILNKTDYAALQSTHSVGFDITAPTPTNSSTSSGAYNQSTSAGTGTLSARCSTETIWNLNPATSFLNWDVLMSSVVHATSGDAVVSVTAGYSISNIISVGVSSTAGIIGEYLSATLSVDYTQSWESSYTAGYTFTVPNGKYGAVVSNAKTTRQTYGKRGYRMRGLRRGQ